MSAELREKGLLAMCATPLRHCNWRSNWWDNCVRHYRAHRRADHAEPKLELGRGGALEEQEAEAGTLAIAALQQPREALDR